MNAGMCGVGYNVYVFFGARFYNNYAFFLKLLDDTSMIAKCWSDCCIQWSVTCMIHLLINKDVGLKGGLLLRSYNH